MWINSKKRVWSCHRSECSTCLHVSGTDMEAQKQAGLAWLEKLLGVSKLQAGVWNLLLGNTESYCLRCSPPFHLPIISFPLQQCLWYLECVPTFAFLFVSLQTLLVKHDAILPLWWGIHWPLICLAQFLFFFQSPVSSMARANSLASSSMYFFHFSSLHSLDINIS